MGDMGGFADLFETFFSGFGGGGAGQGGGGARRRGPRQGDDLRFDLTISFSEAIAGQELLRGRRQLWRLDAPSPELRLW